MSCLELVGLDDQASKYPHQMSGGQQQRVALARALAIEPRVLLLDEPLSALDAKVRAELRDQIRSLQQRLAITTVFVTHDQEEALSMADRVCVMKAGRIEQTATPATLYSRPATAFVAEFVGVSSRVPVERSGDDVVVFGQRCPVRDAAGTASWDSVDALLAPRGRRHRDRSEREGIRDSQELPRSDDASGRASRRDIGPRRRPK